MKHKEFDLTTESVFGTLIKFALPFLFSSFMQAFYGAVDLYVIGQYGNSADIAAVSIGSQVIYIITSFIIGLCMGITVRLGNCIGCKDMEHASDTLSNAFLLFLGITILLTPLMVWQSKNLALIMKTPESILTETTNYLLICSIGFPFVILYNVVASILRGIGNSKTPMCLIGIACIANIILDFLFVGYWHLGVNGAALATIISQCVSSLLGILYLLKHKSEFTFSFMPIRWKKAQIKQLLKVGLPVGLQNMLINISFIFITIIANSRGVIAASAVGVTEKIMSFAFLVPSSMLSAISAITAQNIGAGNPKRAVHTLKYGILISLIYGITFSLLCWITPTLFTSIFTTDPQVLISAGEYLKTYSIDCILIAFTFCLNGYLCGQDQAMITFVHYVISIFAVRIPGAYILSQMFPNSLLPLGLASPLGSIMSLIVLAGYGLFRLRWLPPS